MAGQPALSAVSPCLAFPLTNSTLLIPVTVLSCTKSCDSFFLEQELPFWDPHTIFGSIFSLSRGHLPVRDLDPELQAEKRFALLRLFGHSLHFLL